MTTRWVDQLRVASPCTAAWSEMAGDDCVRFCGQCRKSVYNIAAMDAAEVQDLAERTGGDFCGRLRVRRDGTVVTGDCPVGDRTASRIRWRRAATWLIVVMAPLASWAALRGSSRRPILPPPGPGVSFSDWKDWALDALGLSRFGCEPLTGTIAIPRSPSTPTPAARAAPSDGP